MPFKARVRFIERDNLTLEEYLETEFLEGLDYGQGATGWRQHERERQSREMGKLAKPRLGDKWVTGLDSIPWGVFEQALADAHLKAPTIVEPYLRSYLSMPKKPLAQTFKHYGLTYQTMKKVRKDAIAIIRGCLPIKARRTIALVERQREEEDRLLKDAKAKLKAEAVELFREVLGSEG